MTTREDILKIIRDFPEGIGVPYIRETLRLTNGAARYWTNKLVEEGLVRKEEEFVWRRPYYWFLTYYPVEVLFPPPPPAEYVHGTLVYNVKTDDDAGRTIDITITFDFDCINDEGIKDTLRHFLFLKAHNWLEAKFGAQMPIAAVWAETKELPADSKVAAELKEKELEITALHYKWNYWRQFGDKTEESEGDLVDWQAPIPTGATWASSRKGRHPV